MINLATLLTWFYKRSYNNFICDLEQPQLTQEKTFKKILNLVVDSQQGQALQLKKTDSYFEWIKKVPVRNYSEYQMHDRLTREAVIFYEKTSGSSGCSKYIPYTSSLKKSFQRMGLLWAYDVAKSIDIGCGQIFLSLSSNFDSQKQIKSGVPVGLENDSDYMSPVLKFFLRNTLILPRNLKGIKDPQEFRKNLAENLMASHKLEIISIWSPTYLLVLLDEIKSILGPGFISWENLWPELKLISCWTEAGAALFVPRLQREFPNVIIQGKGLLATEAPMTIPLMSSQDPVPFLNEVFFEFESPNKKISLLHELQIHEEYEVIITQTSGLLRYRIGDRVRVTGFFKKTPTLKFLGRSHDVVDLVGEKLNEDFVSAAFKDLENNRGGFSVLTPHFDPPHYKCYVNHQNWTATHLEARLQQAYHYRQARHLNQLGPVQLEHVPNLIEKYNHYFMSQGLKWGDIKYRSLLKEFRV